MVHVGNVSDVKLIYLLGWTQSITVFSRVLCLMSLTLDRFSLTLRIINGKYFDQHVLWMVMGTSCFSVYLTFWNTRGVTQDKLLQLLEVGTLGMNHTLIKF